MYYIYHDYLFRIQINYHHKTILLKLYCRPNKYSLTIKNFMVI